MVRLESNAYLVLFVLAWTITIIIYQKKKKQFDAGSVLLISYLIFSISSLVLYNSNYYTFKPIRLFPFVYLYLILLMTFWPILRFNDRKIIEIQKPNTALLHTVSLIYILALLIQMPSFILDFSNNITKLLYDTTVGQEIYNETVAVSLDSDRNGIIVAGVISGAMSGIGMLLLMYYLTFEKPNKLILLGLILSPLISILPTISRGERNGIIETLFVFIITYFALRKFIPAKINHRIKLVGIILIIMMTAPFLALTISRFGMSNAGTLESIYFYAGQENLNFNNYALDNGGIRYGDRTFPLFKRMIGFDDVPRNIWERRAKYRNLKIGDERFIGFVGDFALDFGPYITPLIFIFFTLFILNRTRIHKGRILFHQLILLHFVMKLCILGGFKLYPYSDVGGNLQLIVYFLAYILFRLDYGNSLRRKEVEHYGF